MRVIKNGGAILILALIGVAAILVITLTGAAGTATAAPHTRDEIAAMDIRTIDINTATGEQLATLPGIDEVLSRRIIEYREEHGNFADTEDIMNVYGIAEKKYEAIRLYITTE